MIIDLSGKHALVTGSTKGIGYAIAKGLALAGAKVTVNGRSEDSTGAAVEKLRDESGDGEVAGVAADVGTAAGADRLAAAAGAVDILVNNAGVFENKPFFDIPDEDWQRMFDVNVMSAVRLSRALAPAMKDAGWGRILFVSSESAVNTPPEMVHYGFSKTAMLAVSRGLAEVLAGSGVTVNAILPGPTRTAGVERMLKEMGDGGEPTEADERRFIAENRPSSLIGRLAEPAEVANLAVYLASPQASATTGAALRVDGGVVQSIV